MAQHEATGRPNRCSCNPPKTGTPRYTPIRDPPQATDRTLPKIPTQHQTAVSNRPSSPADTTASVRSCNPPNTPLPRCARNCGFPPHTYQPTTQKAAEPMWIPRPTAYAAPPRGLLPATNRPGPRLGPLGLTRGLDRHVRPMLGRQRLRLERELLGAHLLVGGDIILML